MFLQAECFKLVTFLEVCSSTCCLSVPSRWALCLESYSGKGESNVCKGKEGIRVGKAGFRSRPNRTPVIVAGRLDRSPKELMV